MDNLKCLAPESWDPLREAVHLVGKDPSVCSLLDDGFASGLDEVDDDGYFYPTMVGQTEAKLVLVSPEGRQENRSVSDQMKVHFGFLLNCVTHTGGTESYFFPD